MNKAEQLLRRAALVIHRARKGEVIDKGAAFEILSDLEGRCWAGHVRDEYRAAYVEELHELLDVDSAAHAPAWPHLTR